MALHDNRNSQSGDHTSRDAAGRDIHQGADADAVLRFLRDYVFAADQRTETTIKELRRELARVRDDIGIIRDAVHALRERVDDITDAAARDRIERGHRQLALDVRLAGLALLIIIVSVLLALLWHDTYSLAVALRYLAGAGMALLSHWIRS